MRTSTRPLIQVGECLPKVKLPRAGSPGTVSLGDGTSASLGDGTSATVVAFPHPSCPECDRWLVTLRDVVEDLRQWGTRPLAVLPEGFDGAVLAARLGYPVLTDAGSVVRSRIGLPDDVAALVVADRWGAVYDVTTASEEHPVPDGRALVSLVQYIDMQCPECGAPGNEWRQCTPLPLG